MLVSLRQLFQITLRVIITILVTNQILDSMGVTPEQLHNDAMENAPNLKPVEIKGMTEVMAEMMGVSVEELAGMGMPADPNDEVIRQVKACIYRTSGK